MYSAHVQYYYMEIFQELQFAFKTQGSDHSDNHRNKLSKHVY